MSTASAGSRWTPVASFVFCSTACLLAGCRDIDRFDTEEGAAYCGSMVAAPFVHDGFVSDETGRPNLRLHLELDTDSLTEFPGLVTTDDASGLCSPRPILENSPLRAIAEVQNDPLSLLEFGDGREYNFLAWVDSTCQGTLLAVISLMKNDDVEVRLLKPKAAPATAATAADRPGFIVFQLKRRDEGCGF